MCLGIPGRVIEINGTVALVDFWGVFRNVRLELMEEGQSVQPGDYVLNHLGYAVRRIPEESVCDTLALYEVLLSEAGEDPLAADVDAELHCQEEELVLA
jgi:hydrogenase expression/formation protein HypC